MLSFVAFLTLISPLQDSLPDAIDDLGAVDEKRRAAIKKLIQRGETEPSKTIPMLLAALRNEHPGLKERIDGIVAKLTSASWKERDQSMRKLSTFGRHALDLLGRHKDHADPEVSWRVRAAIAEIEGRSKDEEAKEYRRDAAICEILGEVGDKSCIGDLVQALDSKNTLVRLRAAQALASRQKLVDEKQAAEGSEKILKAISSERDEQRRTLLVKAAGGLQSPASVPLLSDLALNESEKNVGLRRAAVYWLGRIGTADAVATVIRSLDSERAFLRDMSLRVLEKVAGNDFGFNPVLDSSKQQDALKNAQAWWAGRFGQDWKE